MDYTHIHLWLNHFPVVGTIIATLLLFYGVWKKNFSIQEVSMVTIFVMALLAIPVFLTGEPAEEVVENLPGVIESIIEEHEEAGELALWAMIIAGIVSLTAVALRTIEHKASGNVVMLALTLSIVASGLMVRTGYLGGQIRHSEIRGDAAITQPGEQAGEDDD